MTRLLLALTVLLKALSAFAQPDPVKFGKYLPSELTDMQDTTNAGAIVLCDYDQVSFEYLYSGLKLIYEKHVRIKILSKEGYKWADVAIPYNSDDDVEIVSRIEALSAFKGPDGKIEKHELKNSDVIDEHVYSYHHVKKFSIPSVKEQCIIEYKYRITSKSYFDFKERYFQWEIPVKWSELRTYIPGFYVYAGAFKNPLPLEIEEVNDYRQFLSPSGSMSVNGAYSRYAAKNIPAFIEEPFIAARKDCLPRMLFQINEISAPGLNIHGFMGTWEKISGMLSENEQFGKVHVSGEIERTADNVVRGISSPFDKMVAIYRYVQKTMLWNTLYEMYVEKNLKKPFEQKSGTGAEINQMMIAMLRKVGLQAYPVIISTRNNGKVQGDYTIIRQFNHVIACVRIDSAEYLLDAIDPNVPFNHLPVNDINGSGLAINGEEPFWVSLDDPKASRRVTNCTFTIGADGKLSVESQVSDNRHYAANSRNELKSSDRESYLRKKFFSKMPDVKILSSEIKNSDSIAAPLNVTLKFETNSFSAADNDFIYLKPKLLFAVTENPFKTRIRMYPVDYNFLREETFVLNVTCPEGYEFSEIPKSIKLSLPGNSIQYVFASTVSGDKINIMTKLNINHVEFNPSEYPDLREIYNQIIAKEQEQIVLKKKR